MTGPSVVAASERGSGDDLPLEIRAWWNWPYGIDSEDAAASDRAFKLNDYM